MRKTPHQSQRGFVTIAQNTDTVDYLELSYLQALNTKATQPNSEYAVIVYAKTESQITPAQRRAFDYVITIEHDEAKDSDWKLSNEWQVFWLTPFKETIKLESDLLFTRDVSHWWPVLQTQPVVLSHGVVDHQGRTATSRRYRKLFDDNSMPDVYNGMMYFRYTAEATQFFIQAKNIYRNWDNIRDKGLINVRDEQPTTDVVYALASMLVDFPTYIPTLDFFKFAHMKPGIQNWSESNNVFDTVLLETDLPEIRVNNVLQLNPIHYYDKNINIKELIDEYTNRSA
jgi:hypothetical protein